MVRTPVIMGLFGSAMGGFIAVCTSFVEVVLRGVPFAELLYASPAMWVVWSWPFVLGLATYQIAAHSAARERPVPWARPLPSPPISVATLAAPRTAAPTFTPPGSPRGESVAPTTRLSQGAAAPARDRPKTIADDGVGGVGGDERLGALTDQLRSLKDQVERSAATNRAKSGYLAALGPELRRRLSLVLGTLESEPDRGQEQAVRAVRELALLLGNVVDLARSEVDTRPERTEDVDLALIVDEVRAEATALARAAHFSARVDGAARWAHADPLRVRQIVMELLQNAFAAAPDGTVQLIVERATPRRDAWIALHVKDTGCGMASDSVERAFDPWDEGAKRIGAGSASGIGLAVCRQLAERMGGRIDIQSDPGIGTTVTLLLPPGAEHAVRRGGPSMEERLAGLPVWVVDGERGATALVRFLCDSGLRARALDDVSSARALASSERPAVVLVDTGLPDAGPWMEDLVIDGVPIIAMTVREEDASRARAIGARAALLRPLDRRVVLAAVDRATDAVPVRA